MSELVISHTLHRSLEIDIALASGGHVTNVLQSYLAQILLLDETIKGNPVPNAVLCPQLAILRNSIWPSSNTSSLCVSLHLATGHQR